MDCHPWFRRLRNALNEARLPAWYQARFIEELQLHFMEMQEQTAMNGFDAMDNDEAVIARLGTPEQLAAEAAKLRRATWAGRHPWFAFILGGPASLLVIIPATVIAFGLALKPFAQGKTLATDPWMGPVMSVLGPAQVALCAVAVCLLLCRSAHRSLRSPWWAIAGCGLVTLLSAMATVAWVPPMSVPGTGNLSLGLSFPFSVAWYQAAAPLLVTAIYAMRSVPPRDILHEEAPPVTLKSAA
ncbi:MAG: hypothetical protein U0892_14790 [Pirellulales bacterium]